MTDIATDAGPADAFTALMSKAAEAADVPQDDAKYGYKSDGTPKKAAGRPRRSPSVEELKAPPADGAPSAGGEGVPADQAPAGAPADRAPDEGKRRSHHARGSVSRETVPSPKAGFITTGINRLYRRAGKVVRAMDQDIGTAILESARNTADPGEPDDSVGAAWEELCKTNPRIRKFVMKCLTGGAWGQLVMAHAPIMMAIIMKPAILKHIPFHALIASVAEPDEDTPEGEGGLPGGMTAGDAGQMADLAQRQLAAMGLNVDPATAAQMQQMARSMMPAFAGGQEAPPGDVSRETGPSPAAFTRQQPRRPAARAARRAG